MNAVRNINSYKNAGPAYKEFELQIEAYDVYLGFTRHAVERQESRGIYEASVLSMIRGGFDYFFGLEDERFIIIDHDLGISAIGFLHQEYGELHINIISVIDSVEPTNDFDTVVIELN